MEETKTSPFAQRYPEELWERAAQMAQGRRAVGAKIPPGRTCERVADSGDLERQANEGKEGIT